MVDEQQMVPRTPIDAFFLRSGLSTQDRDDCFKLVEQLHHNRPIIPASCQGYCSMTILVGNDIVVQFRPPCYRLDLRTTSAAREVYGRFAPETRYVRELPKSGLLAYEMERISGISLRDLRATGATSARRGLSKAALATLCNDFAIFLSRSWTQHAVVDDLPSGMVGRSLRSRLGLLCAKLPERFRPTARNILKHLHHIEGLPWVLTHGDIVAANIMVDSVTCRLTGLVDWAEAEKLPFGVCLYGLEEILGEMKPAGFQYRSDAAELRAMFWAELKDRIPELGRSRTFHNVMLARDLGVLLWHGIAFDDGAIDRVVQERRDVEEIHRLDAFLDLKPQRADMDVCSKL